MSDLLINQGTVISPDETLRRASLHRHIIQDYTPLSRSLRWQLSDLNWRDKGAEAFITGGVPYRASNDGYLSSNAAALLFDNCVEQGPADEPIRVFEVGAGTALFARYFLDDFRDLCRQTGQGFYDRLSYYVTDRSPHSVSTWNEIGLFTEHSGHVISQVWDATDAHADLPSPIRAAICNYALDVLPAAVLRYTQDGWQELRSRTWILDDSALLRQYTTLRIDEIRALAQDRDSETAALLPLLPILENEYAYFPAEPDSPPGVRDLADGSDGNPFVYNYAALMCLERLSRVLEPNGFILVNDYGRTTDHERSEPPLPQSFGCSVAMGLWFPLIERRFNCAVRPDGDDLFPTHARLLAHTQLPNTIRTFRDRFAGAVLRDIEEATDRARRDAVEGSWRQALEGFRGILKRQPRNWSLIAETAEFVREQLRDYGSAIELARFAVKLNPWYSPLLWNVLGDCLWAAGELEEGHECYLRAFQINPDDVRANLNLTRSYVSKGDPRRSLEAVARGLANDAESMFRHAFLEEQQRAIELLAARRHREREATARRQAP